MTLAEGESIMQVVTLRGSNLIEVPSYLLPSFPLFSSKLLLASSSLLPAAAVLVLGDGRRGRQVSRPLPRQVPDELLDQERSVIYLVPNGLAFILGHAKKNYSSSDQEL